MRRVIFIVLLLTSCVTCVHPQSNALGVPQSEYDALVALYNATDGPHWKNNANWLTDNVPWHGVEVRDGHVRALLLGDNNLAGQLPAEIGQLPLLENLYAPANKIGGSIPTQIGQLTALTNLDLGNNQLAGPIPAELSSLSRLNWLWLGENQLDGSIPTWIGGFAGLRGLGLNDNKLTGGIPAEIANLSNIDNLSLQGNQLTGAIPAGVWSLTRLWNLDLSRNQLTGELPVASPNLPDLRSLWLGGNQLEGAIPSWIGAMSNLRGLGLNDNKLIGAIPAQIADLSQLDCLYLQSNQLTGGIPPGVWAMPNLRDLNLGNNRLSGELPSTPADLPRIEWCWLGGNQLTGSIPSWFGDLTTLRGLGLDGNLLTGALPASLGNLVNLWTLNLGNNQLSGPIPPEYGNLAQLQNLFLAHMQLTGPIPAELGNMHEMIWLHIGGNPFTGSIPPELGDLTKLQYLYLYTDQLTGPVPDTLANLTSLRVLHLAVNQLSGGVPAWLGSMPALEEIDWGGNQLTGPIPAALGSCISLRRIYLGDNQLSGSIPPELGALSNLMWLSLAGNRLTGTPPPELGQLTNLLELQLQRNALVGEIPATFANLTALGGLDVGQNGLFSSDPALVSFLDMMRPGWDDTQTVSPTGVSAGDLAACGVTLSWTPILYGWDTGYYEVGVSTAPGGPYTYDPARRTGSKNDSRLTVAGLLPDTQYYLVVRAVTTAGGWNHNEVVSYPASAEVPARTTAWGPTVTNAGSSGSGSLRNAIDYANANPGTTITFNIPTSDSGYADGVFTIKPTSALPEITANGAIIDGSTQTVFTGDTNTSGPEIVLNGSLAGNGVSGLVLSSSNCVVKNLVVNSFQASGVSIIGTDTTGNRVEGCYLGLNASGTAAIANGICGVLLWGQAANNTIGGSAPGSGNVISGNSVTGVGITGAAHNNLVLGNRIGTNAAGTGAVPNSQDGVGISVASASNVIGGVEPGARNVISGNNGNGVAIVGLGCTGTIVLGNYIGTSASGTATVPNRGQGVLICGAASDNTIGGPQAGARNVISGNLCSGIWCKDAGTNGNIMQGNYIGTNAAGGQALGNWAKGVAIDAGASNNFVGGTAPGAGNLISGNLTCGLGLLGGATNTVVQGNCIGTDASGTAAIPNSYSGVYILQAAKNNTIGGTAAGAANVVSGNAQHGILVIDSGTSGNLFQGNRIGTDPTGASAVANAWHGVFIMGGASSNTIGGTQSGAGNVVSGNKWRGVSIEGSNTAGNTVQGNVIGTNAAGSAAIPNLDQGVAVGSAKDTIVGGAQPGAGNLISGNNTSGVYVWGTGTTGNLVQGNRIGTNAAGTAAIPNSQSGVSVSDSAAGNTIGGSVAGAGNIISGNTQNGIALASAGNFVQGNRIGTDAAATAAIPNSLSGVSIASGATGSTIGGTAVGAGNVISGNTQNGIAVGATGAIVQGNLIGTDASGTAAIPNRLNGVMLTIGAATIGGTAAGAGNTISGNLADGILQQSATSSAIHGNRIGTDITGMLALPNGGCGIRLPSSGMNAIGLPNAGNVISGNIGSGVSMTSSSSNNLQANVIGLNAAGNQLPNGGHGVVIDRGANNRIGGAGAGVGNVISGNALNGIYLATGNSGANRIDGNCIGTSADGTEALGNLGCGVLINGPTANYVGTTAPNKIAHNGSDGIRVQGTSSNRNRISANSIYANAGLGINLVGGTEDSYGVTANHTGTATGPNGLQNYPVISSATVKWGSMAISGTLSALPSTAYALEFFASDEADPSGHGEGQTYLGGVSVTTSSTGEASFSFTPTTAPAVGSYVTATAMDPNSNTSEFSLAVQVGGDADQFADIGAGLPGAWGSSLMWGDYDNDGRLDLGVSGVVSYPEWSDYYCETRVFHNEDGAFVDRQTNWIAGGWNSSLEWGDYNNDGYLDLATAGYDAASIYRNDTTGGFVSVPAYLTPVDGCASRAVSWGDYDNDGDMDLAITGVSDTGPSTSVYRNCGNGHFVDIEAGVVGLTGGPALAWVDYDVDGDLDLAVAGRDSNETLVTKLYRNDAGVFVDINAPFVGVCSACMSWADYDNDGYPDLALTGVTSLTGNVQATTRIYDNSGSGTFTDISVAMPGLWDGACAWGDFDNDGDMDLAIAGLDPLVYEDISRVYCYDGGTFRDIHAALIAVNDCGISWGDYDNDGDLDLAISGIDIQDETHANIYRNSNSVGNNAPSSPGGLNAITGSPGEVEFSWQLASDDHTPAVGLTYNLRVGTAPGAGDILNSMSDPVSGFRKIQTTGNCGAMLSHVVNNLLTGTYYWSVQAVDSAFAGSAWAPEQTLAITGNVAVSGTVENPYGVPIRDVPVVASGSTTTTSTTYEDGSYELRMPSGWTGTVSPGVGDWAFDPASRSFDSLTAPRTVQDFVAHPPFADTGVDVADTYAYAAVWGDCNADGLMDVALVNYSLGARVSRHNADGTFSTTVLTSDYGCEHGAWVDHDGDCDLDMSLQVDGNAVVFRNDGAAFAKVTLPVPTVNYGSGVPCWVDLDNDGRPDLAMSGWWDDLDAVAFRLFRNLGDGAFAEMQCDLPGLEYGDIAAADYDGDGDNDLAIGGEYYDSVARRWQPSTGVYRNDGDWQFADSGADLTDLLTPCLRWADFDNDGRPDLFTCDSSVAKLYRNTAGGFVDSGLAPNQQAEVASWGDYDNDGHLDLLLAGWLGGLSIADVYRNDGTALSATNAGLRGQSIVSLSWVDFDGDGRLDAPLISSGSLRLFHNETGPANTPPTAPTGLSAAFVAGNLAIAWDPASDAQTPAPVLTYNIRVGTTPGGNDILSGCSTASGARLVPEPGNAGQNLTWAVRHLAPGTYYIGVQSVDGAFAGSAWAECGTVITAARGIAGAKGEADGRLAVLEDVVVTAVFGDDFYVESADRSSGMRVSMRHHDVTVGDVVDLRGITTEDPCGERYLAADWVKKTGSGFVKPVSMTCKSLGGGQFGAQAGVEGGTGLNSIGLLVRVVGLCSYVDASNVLLDDGSGVRVRCILPEGVPAQSDWGSVALTGICSCERIDGKIERVVRIRGVEDITLQSGATVTGAVSRLVSNSVGQVVESAHPYLDSTNQVWTISGGDGVTRMRVHFTEVELEQDYDYLYVQDGSGKTVQTLNSYPAFTDFWSDWVVGNTIVLNLSTDGSVVKYGFAVDRYEAASRAALQGAEVTIQPGGQTATTDANGLYRFVDLPPGACTLTPSYVGVSFTPSATDLSLRFGECLVGQDFAGE